MLFGFMLTGWSKINNFNERLEKLTTTIMHPEDRAGFWAATRPELVRTVINKDGVYYVNFRTLIDGVETYYQAKFVRDEIHPETNVIAGFHNVDAETRRGAGSTFFVSVPLRLQTEEDIAAESVQEQHAVFADFNGKKVLLVEDNELNREIALDILEDEGMLVETAVNGEMAVNAVCKKGTDYYDFVLMDIQMPVMNGYEATVEIRKLYPDSSLPIIALSANAFEEDRQKSIAAGMNDHVAKPININALKSVMPKFM